MEDNKFVCLNAGKEHANLRILKTICRRKTHTSIDWEESD